LFCLVELYFLKQNNDALFFSAVNPYQASSPPTHFLSSAAIDSQSWTCRYFKQNDILPDRTTTTIPVVSIAFLFFGLSIREGELP